MVNGAGVGVTAGNTTRGRRMSLGLVIEQAMDAVQEELTGELVLGVRPLSAEDLADHAQNGACQPVAMAKRMRFVHHAIARMMATGMKQVEIAAAVGVSETMISLQHRNPAFQELVAFYQEKADKEAFDLGQQIFFAGAEALDVVRDRLQDEDNVQLIPMRELRRLTTDLLDRSGFSPVKRSENVKVSVGLTREELEEVKRGRSGIIRSAAENQTRAAHAADAANRTPAPRSGVPRCRALVKATAEGSPG